MVEARQSRGDLIFAELMPEKTIGNRYRHVPVTRIACIEPCALSEENVALELQVMPVQRSTKVGRQGRSRATSIGPVTAKANATAMVNYRPARL
jgi:hypothetical protein